jgi:hypothetical protein
MALLCSSCCRMTIMTATKRIAVQARQVDVSRPRRHHPLGCRFGFNVHRQDCGRHCFPLPMPAVAPDD